MENSAIELFISGDYCPIGRNQQYIEDEEFGSLFGGLEEDIRSADLSITNLEAPVTSSTKPIKKTGPNLKINEGGLKALKYAGFDLVTLANNHIMDYGAGGLMSTLDACGRLGIKSVGAGKNLEEAKKPHRVTIKGKKIAILNFAENEFCTTTGDHYGANPVNVIQNYYSIREAKSSNDIVILIYHGGREHYNLPTPAQKDRFRFFVDSGADVVIGHHTHCVSGYEVYKEKPILYSLGNFVFDYKKKYRTGLWTKGIAVKLIFQSDSIDFKIIPFHQGRSEDARLEVMQDQEKTDYLNKLLDLNMVICDNEIFLQKWQEYIESQRKEYKSSLIYQNRYLRYLIKNGLLPPFYFHSGSHLRLLLNLFRCESHNEIMCDVLRESIQE